MIFEKPPAVKRINEDQGHLDSLNRLIAEVSACRDNILADFSLLTSAKKSLHESLLEEQLQYIRKWQNIAFRDAAINLFNQREAIDGIRKRREYLPEVFQFIEKRTLKDIHKDFNDNVPNLRHLRDAICHSSHKLRSPKDLKVNAVKGGFRAPGINIRNCGSVTVKESIFDYIYVVTHKRTAVSFQFDNQIVNLSIDVARRVRVLFEPFSADSKRDPREAESEESPALAKS